MAVREGRWDCQYCGTTGILGRNKACTNCGRSRPEGTKFYLPKEGEEEEVKEQKLVEQAKIGPDWVCEFCGSSNPANVNVCGSCHAPREAVSPQQAVKEYAVGQAPKSGDMDLSTPPERPTPTPKKSKAVPAIGIAGAAAGLLFLCLCIVVGYLVFGNRDAQATVSGFSWQRTIAVESFQTVTEEDWEVPQGGRILSQQEEIHHYDQVIDHYETRTEEVAEQVQVGERTYVCGQRDLGNGFFEDIECTEPVYETQYHTESREVPIYRDEPVYQTKYTYEIDKWVVVRTEEDGGTNHSASWPETNLADGEREGERTEMYIVQFTDEDGKVYSWETTENDWLGFEMGQGVTLKLDALGNEVEEVEI